MLIEAFEQALAFINANSFAVWTPPLSWPLPRNRRFLQAVATLDREITALIAERRAAQGPPRGDLLDMLLAMTGPQGMDDRQLRDELVTLFFAGHETTALTLTWAWYLLHRHPRALARVAEEVAALEGRPPSFGDLPRLPYARMVLDETLRLYPPAWVFIREAVEEDSILGYRVPQGAHLLLSPYLTHRDPRYREEPTAFRPERFAPGTRGTHPLAHYPFGAGQRMCIGRDFALMEATAVLARMVQRVTVQPVEDAPV